MGCSGTVSDELRETADLHVVLVRRIHGAHAGAYRRNAKCWCRAPDTKAVNCGPPVRPSLAAHCPEAGSL